MRLREVPLEPYFQRFMDIRPLAPTRGEMFTRPDTLQPTAEFFASLKTAEHVKILAWLLKVADEVHTATGVQSSINVDPSIVSTERGRNEFLRIAAATQSPVTFEFGEESQEWPVESANRLFVQIRERGHESALDNFGKDDPDLGMLRALQFDTIKIAGAATIGIDRNAEAQERLEALFHAIVDAGKQHVVQGVESQAAFRWLQEVGFTTFQGYWFSIPQPASALTRKH